MILSSIIVIALLLWNKKNIRHLKRIQKLESSRQREFLKASIQGQENERKRISENLHDDIGPLLSIIKHSINNFSALENISKLNEVVDQTITTIKQISHSLTPSILHELGLNEAIKYIAESFKECSKIHISVIWNDLIESYLSEKDAVHVYRILQESLNNVIKHSNGDSCILIGKVANNIIELEIVDNGDVDNINSIEGHHGMGIRNIMARTIILNGECNIKMDDGFNVSIKIPIND